MPNKKIIIIGPAYPLRGGGISTSTERLALQFTNQGQDCTIYTFSLQYPNFLFPGTSQFSTEAAPANIKIKVCINSVNPLNWVKVGNELKNLKPDLIIVRFWMPFFGPCLGTILRLAKKNKHTKVVCIPDNILPHEKRMGDGMFTKYFVKPVDAYIPMSQKVMTDLQTVDKAKPAEIVALPLFDGFGEAIPTDEAKKILGISPDKKMILFFGFIRKYKGLDLLFDAIKIIKDKGQLQNFVVVVAGEFYENQQNYLNQIAELGIGNLLDLRNHFIADSEVKNYICAADVIVQPYRNATQSGVTPLAFHFEKPMVVTNVGGLPSQAPHGKVGLVCEPNGASIAAALEQFFTYETNHFLDGIKDEKKKYDWANLTAALLKYSA